ncbi:MAG TPA: DJ-1/PfpI family protein [Polyangiaceae bacterium]
MPNQTPRQAASDSLLTVAILIYDRLDQLDATGPFEVLAQMSNVKVDLVSSRPAPVLDMRGLTLVPTANLTDLSAADVLVVPGGAGQEALMDDATVLGWLQRVGPRAQLVLSVCTGALLLGAAGLLRGRRATTHWSAHDLLPFFGAVPVRERLVVDGNLLTSAGVTAGIDAALLAVAKLRGEASARAIQLGMEYAPAPPFEGGTPDNTPLDILSRVQLAGRHLHDRRMETAQRVRRRLGVK